MTQEKNSELRQNTVPVALCPSQIPCRYHGIEPWPLKILPLLGQQQANYCRQSTRWSPLVVGVSATLRLGSWGCWLRGNYRTDTSGNEGQFYYKLKTSSISSGSREKVNSANVFRMGSDNPSRAVNLCACAPIALLTGIISLQVGFTMELVYCSWKFTPGSR
jgi:hypothetical protein